MEFVSDVEGQGRGSLFLKISGSRKTEHLIDYDELLGLPASSCVTQAFLTVIKTTAETLPTVNPRCASYEEMLRAAHL